MKKDPFRLPASQRQETKGERGIIGVMTLELMQALMAQVLYHSNTGLLRMMLIKSSKRLQNCGTKHGLL